MEALHQQRKFEFGCLAPAVSALFNSTYFLDNDYKNNNNNDNDNDVQEGEDFNNNNNNNNNNDNYDDDNYVDDLNGSNSGFPFICALYRVDMDLERSHYLIKFK